MSPPVDFATAMGRLLTDAGLRRGFQLDPRGTVDAIGANPDVRTQLLELSREGLEVQAQTLLSKRFHAVSQLLPMTLRRLGSEARPLFLEYAAGNWPRGHLRHAEDAWAFGAYLRRRGIAGVLALEWNRVAFLARGRKFRVYWARRTPLGGRIRWALQVLVRAQGHPRQFLLYFALG